MKTSTKLSRAVGLSVAGSVALGLGLASPAMAGPGGGAGMPGPQDYTYQGEADGGSGYPLYIDSVADNNQPLGYTPNPQIFQYGNGDNAILDAYCVDVDVPSFPNAGGALTNWIDSKRKDIREHIGNRLSNAGQQQQNEINWVVANSYPKVDIESLASDSGVAGLTQEEAVTATQAAIWNLANDVEFDFSKTLGEAVNIDGAKERIKELFGYLTGSDNTGLQFTGELENASVDLKTEAFKEARKTESGYEVGTLEVDLKAIGSISIQADSINGVEFTLLDKDGKVVELDGGVEAKDGDSFTVVVESHKDVNKLEDTIVFTTNTVVNTSVTGGVVQPTEDDRPSESLVLVDGDEETLEASAKLSFSITLEAKSAEASKTSEDPEATEKSEDPEAGEQSKESEAPEQSEDSKPADQPKESEAPKQQEDPEANEQPEDSEAVEAQEESEDAEEPVTVVVEEDPADAQATADDQKGSLAETGAEHVWALVSGGLLLLSGGIALFLVRRRAM